MAMNVAHWAVILVALYTGVDSVYVFEGNPFESDGGPLKANTRTLTKADVNIAAHTEVFYPTRPGTYVPIIFLPGLYTLVYAEAYTTVLANFAAYGYIVAGIDLFWPAQAQTEGIATDTVFEVIQWLEYNLDKYIESGVKGDWSKLGLLSHSASADYLVEMLYQNTTFAKAVAFLEPWSDHFTKQFGYSIPALSYGTQLCFEGLIPCCIRGLSYRHFYKELECPKIMMNITGYGHCDVLDDPLWDVCDVSHFCKVDKTNNRQLYREEFVPGLLASFFGSYLQGNPALLKFITTADLMPVPVTQLSSMTNCSSYQHYTST